jgi:hypothetical protein
MNSGHHIVREIRAAHQSREEAARTWNNLVHDRQAALWITATWLGVFALIALCGAWLVSSRPELRLLYFPPVAFLAITSPIIVLAQQRRERALLRLIAQEAPELSERLKRSGVQVSGAQLST